MFYFFYRGGVTIRCEVRMDALGEGYELVIERPDAMVRVERFRESAGLNERWADLQQALRQEGWGGPHIRDT
jgi:hypothetical protein